jgi:hypothetical protein
MVKHYLGDNPMVGAVGINQFHAWREAKDEISGAIG